jgi:hypothetical protein
MQEYGGRAECAERSFKSEVVNRVASPEGSEHIFLALFSP